MSKSTVKNNFRSYVIVSIFLVFLYGPTLIFPFVKGLLAEDTSENRKLATFPELNSLQDLTKFPTRFDSYWSDNLPFRNTIRQAYADVNFLLFRASSSSKVVVGRDDGNWRHTWLFYNDKSEGDPLNDVRGVKRLTGEQENKILAIMERNRESLGKHGISLYYIIAPNKSTVYEDYLPDSVNVVDEVSLTSDLSVRIQKSGFKNFVFLKDAMDNEKQRMMDGDIATLPLYHLTDTHWNEYGAFIGAKALLKMADAKFDEYDDYDVRSEGFTDKTGDLNKFMNLSLGLQDVQVEVAVDLCRDYEQEIVSGSVNMNQVLRTKAKDPLYHKKILFVGDSFRTAMIPWLSGLYDEAIYMHGSAYKSSMLDEYEPDIVVIETVERYASGGMGVEL